MKEPWMIRRLACLMRGHQDNVSQPLIEKNTIEVATRLGEMRIFLHKCSRCGNRRYVKAILK